MDRKLNVVFDKSKILRCNRDIAELKNKKDKITENELKLILRRYNLRDGLISLGQISSTIFNTKNEHRIGGAGIIDQNTGVYITQFALAYLANILIISGANDYKVKQISDHKNILALCNIFSNSIIRPDTSKSDGVLDDNGFTTLMLRLAFEQFELQFEHVFVITRTIIIFGEICNNISSNKIDSISYIFKNETGISIEEYFSLAILIWAGARETASFRLEMFTQIEPDHPLSDTLTEQKIRSFLTVLKGDYVTFRELDAAMNSKLDEKHTTTRFNTLLAYPVIETDKQDSDPYLIPNTHCYVKKAFGGLYWWFHKYFEDRGRHLDFRQYFGEIFESYVGVILKETYGHDKIKPEIIYPKGKFIDWWLIEGEKVYLFEAKSYQFPLEIKQSLDLERLIAEIRLKIAKTVEQVYDRIQDIGNYEELAMFKGKQIVPTIVFLDIPLASSPVYQKIIKSELEEIERKGKQDITKLEVFFIGIDELESFQATAGTVEIDKIFNDYKDDPTQGFLSTLNKKYAANISEDFYLNKKFKLFWQEITGMPFN